MITTTYRGDIEVMPYCFRLPFSERYEWATDIVTTHRGIDDRYQIRNIPRRTFTFNVATRDDSVTKLYLKVYNSLTSKWAVPMWVDSQKISSTIPAGSVEISSSQVSNIPMFDFPNESLAILWKSSLEWEVVEIQTGASNILTLLNPTIKEFTSGSLIPLRVGRLTASRSNMSYRADYNFIFRVEDNTQPTFTDIFFDNQVHYWNSECLIFNDKNLCDEGYKEYTFHSNIPCVESGRMEEEFEGRVDLMDNTTGIIDTYSPWKNNRSSKSFKYVVLGSKIKELKQWFFDRAGRYNPFWMPSFENNLPILSTGMVSDTILVKDVGDISKREHISVQTRKGEWTLRKVLSTVEQSEGVLQITLESPLNIQSGSIKNISFLGLNSLKEDNVEFIWEMPDIIVVSFGITEVSP